MIIARDLGVSFNVDVSGSRSLKRLIASAAVGGVVTSSKNGSKTVDAIKGANFQISHGDRVGLVGHNGSGKTTMLRVLSGIYQPTYGSIEINGKVNALLDIGVGLDSDSTGYQNIYIRGILLGLDRKEISRRVDEIAEFSELGDYLELPLRSYSSGMLLRLAFSVATIVNSEILLLDEWLSVGDAAFNKKATHKLNQMIDESSLMVLASHSVELIESTCNRVLMLDHGVLREIGLQQYKEMFGGS